MKKFMIIVGVITMFAYTAEAEFADKRFNRKLTALDPQEGVVTLSENQIYADNGSHKFYYDCKLVENKIGYLKYFCSDVYLEEAKDTADKTHKQTIEFKIKKYVYSFGEEYLVQEYDYDGLDKKKFTGRTPYMWVDEK